MNGRYLGAIPMPVSFITDKDKPLLFGHRKDHTSPPVYLKAFFRLEINASGDAL